VTFKALFSRAALATAALAGHPVTFAAAVALIVGWGATGPLFHYSDTWQLVINTGTTIITFLMVFLLQHTQNRDTLAMHAKLDELIRSHEGARNSLIAIERRPGNDDA
jgi:low affinity Fe/Cu permease